ncbi:MAG: SMP-30/gluconolactonase/LRE family protein [Roseiarcus sp.]
MTDGFAKILYRLWPGHVIGEVLSKRWTETAIPVLALILIVVWLSVELPGFFSPASFPEMFRQAGEIGLVVLGLSLVLIVGGIDLSVGSIFALSNFTALLLVNVYGWNVGPAIFVTLLVGAALGAVNGFLIGILKLRAFLTTLITLIVYRAIYELLIQQYSTQITAGTPDSAVWDFLGIGNVYGVTPAIAACVLVAVVGHLIITRARVGWHIMAIGGSRRAAFNAGIKVESTIALCYVVSGILSAASAVFFAARLSTVAGEVGLGLEVTALTAAILGGISLGGGNGSVTKALLGTMIVLLVRNGLINMSVPGGGTRMILAVILLISAVVDIKWNRNRLKLLNKVYVSPTYHELPPAPECSPQAVGPYRMNDRLADVETIGLGEVEGPEDVILDRDDNLYTGTRHGDIMRFLAPDYKKVERFAHIGGVPLGLAFDKSDNLYVCVGGMGLYYVTPSGEVKRATDETNATLFSIIDDSRLRLADDLDIAPDGRIFFSEATIRYEMHDWPVDALEGRGNGRIICYDPRDKRTRTVLRGLHFPNGICLANDRQSILFVETWNCSVSRYYFDGPKNGKVEKLIENLPGYPDNINEASDGNYWLAISGMRNPVFDLAQRLPGFRKRMAARLPADEWLAADSNKGGVLKFNDQGEIIDSLWDIKGRNHPMITSMREHKGYLYLGGISNNRVGRYRLPGADPNYVQSVRRWGSR